MTFWKWSKTAANNSNADSTINWAEGQAPSSVNDSARALMAAGAKYRDDISGMLNTAGTATAYTLTSNQNLTSLTDGFTIYARVNVTSGVNPTLLLDALAAKEIRAYGTTDLPAGAMFAGGIYGWTYDSGEDCWYIRGFISDQTIIPATTSMIFFQAAAPTGWTKSTAHNDKALRIVSGAGGGTGGSVAFATAFASQTPTGTVGNTTLTVDQIPSHNHVTAIGTTSVDGPFANIRLSSAQAGSANFTSSSVGGGGSHTHSFTGNAINLAVQYCDVIICTKD